MSSVSGHEHFDKESVKDGGVQAVEGSRFLPLWESQSLIVETLG